MIILKNCKLIRETTEGYSGAAADILLKDSYICKIRPIGFDFNIKNAHEIDLEFKTLLPGLFDLHCHLGFTFKNALSWSIKEPAERVFDAYKYAKAFLMSGFTTIRDVGSDNNIAIATRDAVNRHIIDGPRIFACGKIITPSESGNNLFSSLYVEANNPYEIRKSCRKEFEKGADFIKVMASGAVMNCNSNPSLTIIQEDELIEAVKTSSLKQSYVAAHCHGAHSILLALKSGVRTIEHGSFINKEGIELLKSSGSYMIPTLFIDAVLMENKTEGIDFMKDKMNRLFNKEIDCLTNAYDNGIKLGFGTDADYNSFCKNPGYEFILRKKFIGMKEVDIILQATKYSAKILNCDNILGSIKEGKYADLIVVDGNPLEKIELMNTGIVHVFKEGIRYK